ncbi:MAG: hypothetical protein CR959_00660 [Fusobacteriales bacterium]|nr:MAG: hypothetical protein CR959_00660 [Fusobacteriales bacterium]
MLKNKIKICLMGAILFTACSSADLPQFSNFSKTKVPAKINEAIATRVNPETELYALGGATLSKSGAIVAQAKANKYATNSLRKDVEKEVTYLYKTYLNDMDTYSKSIVSPVISDLKKYSVNLSLKKIEQKGAWQDADKIYSLLVLDRSEVQNISQKVIKNFIDNAARKLENISSTVIK